MRPGPGINLSSNLWSTSRRNADTMPDPLSFQPTRTSWNLTVAVPTERDSSSISIPRLSPAPPIFPPHSSRRILLGSGIFRSGRFEEIEEKVFVSAFSTASRPTLPRRTVSTRWEGEEFLEKRSLVARRLENYLILDSFPNIFLHNSLQLSFEPIFVVFTSRKLNVFLLFFPSFRPPFAYLSRLRRR